MDNEIIPRSSHYNFIKSRTCFGVCNNMMYNLYKYCSWLALLSLKGRKSRSELSCELAGVVTKLDFCQRRLRLSPKLDWRSIIPPLRPLTHLRCSSFKMKNKWSCALHLEHVTLWHSCLVDLQRSVKTLILKGFSLISSASSWENKPV